MYTMEKLFQFLYYKKMVNLILPLYLNTSFLFNAEADELDQIFLKLWLNEKFYFLPLLEPWVSKTIFFFVFWKQSPT